MLLLRQSFEYALKPAWVQASATQLQHPYKNHAMAKGLQRLYFKREFEVALNTWLLWCTCIFFLSHLHKYAKI